jgi:ribosome-associated heat shock protein Hsp15
VRNPATLQAVRADKWLWAARLFPSRALAAQACAGGKLEVNGHVAKASRLLRPGDALRVTLRSGRRILRVAALADRRGPAAVARTLYDDLTPPEAPRIRTAPPALRLPGAGRPTKRERRLLDRLRAR